MRRRWKTLIEEHGFIFLEQVSRKVVLKRLIYDQLMKEIAVKGESEDLKFYLVKP